MRTKPTNLEIDHKTPAFECIGVDIGARHDLGNVIEDIFEVLGDDLRVWHFSQSAELVNIKILCIQTFLYVSLEVSFSMSIHLECLDGFL